MGKTKKIYSVYLKDALDKRNCKHVNIYYPQITDKKKNVYNVRTVALSCNFGDVLF